MGTRLTQISQQRIASLDGNEGTKLGACDTEAEDMYWHGVPCANLCRSATPRFFEIIVLGELTGNPQTPGRACDCDGSAYFLPETYVVEQNLEANPFGCLYSVVPCPGTLHTGGMDGTFCDSISFDASLGLVRITKGDAVGAFRSPNWESDKPFDCRNIFRDDFTLKFNEAGECDWSGIDVIVRTRIGAQLQYPCTFCGCRDIQSEPWFWDVTLNGTPADGTCDCSQFADMRFKLNACGGWSLGGANPYRVICDDGTRGLLVQPIVNFARSGCQHTLSVSFNSGPADNPGQVCTWAAGSWSFPVASTFNCCNISQGGTLPQLNQPGCVPACNLDGMTWNLTAICGGQQFNPTRAVRIPPRPADDGCSNCGYDAASDPDFPQELL